MATINGTSGDDFRFGDVGDDNIFGKAGDDNLYGGAGDDKLYGGIGNDNLFGETGNDNLFGEAGNDNLEGNFGNDRLNGGSGNDLLIGGPDNDRFVFRSGTQFTPADLGIDTIRDFTPGEDKIVLSKTTFTGIDSVVGNGFSQRGEFRVVENQNVLSNLLNNLGSVNIVYNLETRGLSYIDDNPLELRFTRFATVQGDFTSLSANDFQIVA